MLKQWSNSHDKTKQDKFTNRFINLPWKSHPDTSKRPYAFLHKSEGGGVCGIWNVYHISYSALHLAKTRGNGPNISPQVQLSGRSHKTIFNVVYFCDTRYPLRNSKASWARLGKNNIIVIRQAHCRGKRSALNENIRNKQVLPHAVHVLMGKKVILSQCVGVK